VQAISANAKELDDFRSGWLNSIEGEVGVTITMKTARRYTLTNLYNALSLYRENYVTPRATIHQRSSGMMRQ
jgi:hypothetical protein